jgi:hypothetical protein
VQSVPVSCNTNSILTEVAGIEHMPNKDSRFGETKSCPILCIVVTTAPREIDKSLYPNAKYRRSPRKSMNETIEEQKRRLRRERNQKWRSKPDVKRRSENVPNKPCSEPIAESDAPAGWARIRGTAECTVWACTK